MPLEQSTRYKLYQPTVSTDEFPVGFPVFGTQDLTVYVDGVLEPVFSLSATFVNGRSDDATIQLVAGVSDVDVEIYGTRIPRRDDEYLANSPNLAQRLQEDADRITAVQQEQARDFLSAIRVAPNAPVVTPLSGDADERASKVLTFSADGLSLQAGLTVEQIEDAKSYAAQAAASAAEADEVLGASTSATTQVRRDVASGAAAIAITPRPLDGTSIASVTFFRDTVTSGEARIRVHNGDGTTAVRHELVAGGASFFGAKLARTEFHPIAFGSENGPNLYDFLFSQIRYQASDPNYENLRVGEVASDGDHGGDHAKWDFIRGGWRDNSLTPLCNLPSDGDPLFALRFTGRRLGPGGDEYNTPAVTYAMITSYARSVSNTLPSGVMKFHTIQGGTGYTANILSVPRLSIGTGVWYEDGAMQDPGLGNLLMTNVAAKTRLMATTDSAATYRTPGAAFTVGQIVARVVTSNRALDIETVADGIEYRSAFMSSGAEASHVFKGGAVENFRIGTGGWFKSKVTTVANLVAAATAGLGARAFVSDATAATFASAVAGGGSNKVPVYSDGANWRIG